jgi:hypothetical protein
MYQLIRLFILSCLQVTACFAGGESEFTKEKLGPYKVSQYEYRFKAKKNKLVLNDRKTEIWASIYYPSSIKDANKAPLLLFTW